MHEAMATTFAALGDPTRIGLLARLSQGEADVTTLCEGFAMSQPAISHHLKVLEQAGLLERTRDGTRRPCRIVPGRLAEIDHWLEQFRAAMEENYSRLDLLLEEKADEF